MCSALPDQNGLWYQQTNVCLSHTAAAGPHPCQRFYLFTVFLVQTKVSDGDVRLFLSLSAALSRPCDHFTPGTCLRLRRECSTAQGNRSADEGSAIIPVLFPWTRNIAMGFCQRGNKGSLKLSSSAFLSFTRAAAVIVNTSALL